MNRNQHYVPQFYLRNFSLNNDKKTIGVLVLKDRNFIGQGPSIKKQASEDYFYGKDSDIDKGLTTLEDSTAECIQEIINNNSQLNECYECQTYLKFFTVMLSVRTKHAGDESDELIDKTFKLVLEKDPRYKGDLDKIKFGTEISTLLPIQTAAKSYPFYDDLKISVVINETEIPLISSDNPVVLYNQFLESKNAQGGITGLGSKGLQMFLPISPKHLLILYDNNVYRIGNKYDKAYQLSNKEDIHKINKLQVINSDEVVYFNEEMSEDLLMSYIEARKLYKPDDKVNVQEYISSKNKNESLIVQHSNEIRCSLDLSFIRIVKKAQKYVLGNKSVHLRNEELFRLYSLFLEKVKEGAYKENEFMKFLKKVSSY